MNLTIFNDPWKHIVIENYYDSTLFKNMLNEIKNDILPNIKFEDKDNEVLIYRDTNLLSFKHTKKCLYSKSILPNLLKFFPNHRKSNRYSIQKELVITGNYEYRIHDEAPHKILSMTTYVYPENSKGTLLYNTDMSFNKEINWRQNSSVLFAGMDNITWHNYKNSDSNNLRVTINQFLIGIK